MSCQERYWSMILELVHTLALLVIRILMGPLTIKLLTIRPRLLIQLWVRDVHAKFPTHVIIVSSTIWVTVPARYIRISAEWTSKVASEQGAQSEVAFPINVACIKHIRYNIDHSHSHRALPANTPNFPIVSWLCFWQPLCKLPEKSQKVEWRAHTRQK